MWTIQAQCSLDIGTSEVTGPNYTYFVNHILLNLLPLKSELQVLCRIQFVSSFEGHKIHSTKGNQVAQFKSDSMLNEGLLVFIKIPVVLNIISQSALNTVIWLGVSYSQYNCILVQYFTCPCYVTVTIRIQLPNHTSFPDARSTCTTLRNMNPHFLELCLAIQSLSPDALEYTYLHPVWRRNPVILLHQEKERSSRTLGSEEKSRYRSQL